MSGKNEMPKIPIELPQKEAPIQVGDASANTSIGITTKEEEDKKMKMQLAGIDSSVLNFESGSMDQMVVAAEMMIKGGFLPAGYQDAASVISAVKYASELGFSPLVGINNIHVIEGKPTLSVHGLASLLQRAGWDFELLQDPSEENGWLCKIKFINRAAFQEYKDKLDEVSRMEADVRSMFVDLLETLKQRSSQVHSYSWTEAEQAGLTTKRNWQRMPKIMIKARCLSVGARFVAPKALSGMYETTEIAETANPQVIDVEAVEAQVEGSFQ